MNKKLILILSGLACLLFSCKGKTENNSVKENSDIAANNNVTKLAPKDYLRAYTLTDKEFGTETVVTLKNGKRIIKTNALPNHKVGAFPNPGNPNTISAQEREYKIPLEPVFTGQARWVRETGIAINGVKFEPETNERIHCSTGETYRIEAKQNLVDMGLDFNNAHVQPTGAYHYHAAPVGVIKAFDTGEDLVHIGFAKDGFLMYYSKSGKYKPSFQLASKQRSGTECEYNRPHQKIEKDYKGTKADGTFVQDWEFIDGLGDLDECNGISINGTYAYLVTDEYPYIGRCLNGKFKEEHHGPPPHHQNGNREHRHGRPNHHHAN